ncbi:hypothetical protein DAEQUDRAFT_769407 [Daedalea quercina L-15889]|uniref:Zn(2)-C6 fungal-type domain-containing protein n=1 Tax=Daedalea quercina L-15889 TaxID=1314783 RepID=A0A165LRP6_9APHY|nr:hypothetical protein DAEQUDRAFT_769407 [Daedalea quercina L-15889]
MPSTTSATPSPHTGPLLLPPTARRSRAAAAGLHLIFDCASDRQSDFCADSPSSYSDASFSSVSSAGPATPLSRPSSPVVASATEENAEGEDCWNLIPYHVPWGNEYYDYTPGMLPGPEGHCFFLRSPTPLKYKRTMRACIKCRDRKAKCSGDRPACTRCVSRGYICQYDPEEPKRTKGPELSRQRLRTRSHRCGSESSAAASEAAADPSSHTMPSFIPAALSPKREEVEMLSELGGLTYSFTEGDAGPWGAPHVSEPSMLEAFQVSPDVTASHHLVPPKDLHEIHSLLLQHDHVVPSNTVTSDPWSHAVPSPLHQVDASALLPAAAVYAPKPLKHAQVPFLSVPVPQRPQPPPPIVIPQLPILQAAPVPVAESEREPARAPEPEPVWQKDGPVAAEQFVAYSVQGLVDGYMAYDYAPASVTYSHMYPQLQGYAAQAYYDSDLSLYGQGVGVAPAATYTAPTAPYVSYAA